MRRLLVFPVIILLTLPAAAALPPRVALIANRYDGVDKWLELCRVPYSIVKYADLNDPGIFLRHDVIFFPSGMEPTPETSINILSRGTSIQGVTLKEGHSELNRKELARKLRAFIDGGGSAYFSGFSWELLNAAYGDFSFFYGFPYSGSAGTIELRLEDDLFSFVSMPRLTVHVPFSGWVAVKSISDADVLAEGRFETPRGKKKGPVIARLKRKRGEAYYTGYYTGESGNPIMRFLVIRVVFGRLLSALEESAGRWDQAPGVTLVDMLLPGEQSRRYTVPLRKGRNTLYFRSENGFFQADVYSGDEIIASRQSVGTDVLGRCAGGQKRPLRRARVSGGERQEHPVRLFGKTWGAPHTLFQEGRARLSVHFGHRRPRAHQSLHEPAKIFRTGAIKELH